jgi:hypothetical protein
MSDSLTLRQAQDFFRQRQATMPLGERTKYAKARWAILSGVPCLMAGSFSLHTFFAPPHLPDISGFPTSWNNFSREII